MPGSITAITDGAILGTATHPRHAQYPMLVHLIMDGIVQSSTIADRPEPGGTLAFTLEHPPTQDRSRMRVLLAETDEDLPHPAFARRTRRAFAVEDLLALPTRRPWVDGTCHIDLAELGFRPQTIIDLICRDYLGRPAGPVVLAAAMEQLGAGQGFDDIRRTLLAAGEYRYRRIHADVAPGTLLGQAMVRAVAGQDFDADSFQPGSIRQVSAAALLQLQGEEFVIACYRQILRKEPDRAGLSHYVHELQAGVTRLDIVRHLASEFEAISAGTQVVDLPDDT